MRRSRPNGSPCGRCRLVGGVTAVVGLIALDLELTGGLLGGSGLIETAGTMVFTTLVPSRPFNAFNAGSDRVSAFVHLFENRLLWPATAVTVAAQVAVVHFAPSAPRSTRGRCRSRSGRPAPGSRAPCWSPTRSVSS